MSNVERFHREPPPRTETVDERLAHLDLARPQLESSARAVDDPARGAGRSGRRPDAPKLAGQQDLAIGSDSYSLSSLRPTTYREYHVAILAHAPHPIEHEVPSAFHEAVVDRDGSRHYGYVHVGGDDPAAYERARRQLAASPAMRSALLQLEHGGVVRRDLLRGTASMAEKPIDLRLTTTLNPHAGQGTDVGGLEMQWNPNATDDCQTGRIDGDVVLGHEVMHAIHGRHSVLATVARSLTPAGEYVNREELLAIRHEQEYSQRTGRDVRTVHVTWKELTPELLAQAPPDLVAPRGVAAPFLRFASSRIELCGEAPGWRAYYRAQLRGMKAESVEDALQIEAELARIQRKFGTR